MYYTIGPVNYGPPEYTLFQKPPTRYLIRYEYSYTRELFTESIGGKVSSRAQGRTGVHGEKGSRCEGVAHYYYYYGGP